MEAPETVTEAVQLLTANGYRSDFVVDDAVVHCHSCSEKHLVPRLVIRDTFRFEGISDPGDEAIVLGVECPSCHAKGIVVSAYGPDADPRLVALLDHLTEDD